jgi:hypothetical protein
MKTRGNEKYHPLICASQIGLVSLTLLNPYEYGKNLTNEYEG